MDGQFSNPDMAVRCPGAAAIAGSETGQGRAVGDDEVMRVRAGSQPGLDGVFS